MKTARPCDDLMEQGASVNEYRTPVARLPMPFSGKPEEDPGLFLESALAYFKENATPESEWVMWAMDWLRGEAAAWMAELPVTDWLEVECALEGRFNSKSRRERGHFLYLYGRQELGEEAMGFILRKRALAKRFCSTHSEQEVIQHTMDLLLPQCQARLQSASASWSKLLAAAAGCESRGSSDDHHPLVGSHQQGGRWPAQEQQQGDWQPAAYHHQTERQSPGQKNRPMAWQPRPGSEQETARSYWHCSGSHLDRSCPDREGKPSQPESSQDEGEPEHASVSMLRNAKVPEDTLRAVEEFQRVEETLAPEVSESSHVCPSQDGRPVQPEADVLPRDMEDDPLERELYFEREAHPQVCEVEDSTFDTSKRDLKPVSMEVQSGRQLVLEDSGSKRNQSHGMARKQPPRTSRDVHLDQLRLPPDKQEEDPIEQYTRPPDTTPRLQRAPPLHEHRKRRKRMKEPWPGVKILWQGLRA